jgi:hypothetical protein
MITETAKLLQRIDDLKTSLAHATVPWERPRIEGDLGQAWLALYESEGDKEA